MPSRVYTSDMKKKVIYWVGINILPIKQDYGPLEDVCAEVWYKVYKSIGEFKSKSAFSTWLHSIAKNTAIDYLRSQRNKIEFPIEVKPDDSEKDTFEYDPADNTETNDMTEPEPIKHAIAKDMAECIYEAMISKLTKQQYRFYKCMLLGWKSEKIAIKFQTNEDNVNSTLSQARKTIKLAIKPKYDYREMIDYIEFCMEYLREKISQCNISEKRNV
jgi:RNA polymerase sigma-70 factor (ECF subfamily)